MNHPGRTKWWLLILWSIIGQTLEQMANEVNVFFINSANNRVAVDGLEEALLFFQQNPEMKLKVNLLHLTVNQSDSSEVLISVCRAYEESVLTGRPPHLVLNTIQDLKLSNVIRSFTKSLGLPTASSSFGPPDQMTPWISLDFKEQNYLLNVIPPAKMIPQIVKDLVVKLQLPNAAVLYDETFSDLKNHYCHLFGNLTVKHVISPVEVQTPRATLYQLHRLLKIPINSFFILGSMDTIRCYLESVEPSEVVSQDLKWFGVTMSPRNLSWLDVKNFFNFIMVEPRLSGSHLPGLKEHQNSLELSFFFELSRRTILAARIAAGSLKEYLSCSEFSGTNTPLRDTQLRQFFQNLTLPEPFAAFYFLEATRGSQTGGFYMDFVMDISVVKMNGSVVMTKELVGNWSSGPTLQTKLAVSPAALKRTIHETVYRVYTIVVPPFVMKDETAPHGYKGLCIDLLEIIARESGVEYVIYEETHVGSMDENGSWNGIMRRLMDHEADIGLGPIFVLAERESVVDFTVPFYDMLGISVMMLKPSSHSSYFIFLKVLQTDVWFCILGGYLFTSFLMWVFDRWSPSSFQNNRQKYKDDDEKREFNFKECLWFCMNSLTPQGGGPAPKCNSGRLLAATWWLFGFIIMSSYMANLAAFLTVARLESTIESFEDLTKQYQFVYAPLNGSKSMNFFKQMSDIGYYFYDQWRSKSLNESLSALERSKVAVWDYPISDKYTKIWSAMKEAGLPNSLEEAVARVRNSTAVSGYAYIGESVEIQYLTMNNCDLRMVGEEFAKKTIAFPIQQGSPLQDTLNSIILKFLSQGGLEKLKAKWWKNEDLKCEEAPDPSDGIGLDNIGGLFLVVLLGIILAFLAVLMEYFCFAVSKRKKIKTLSPADPRKLIEIPKPKNKL